MDKKTIKSLIYKAASLLLLAIFLCTSVFIYLQKSFGWFSDNDEVSASGLSVQASSGLNTEVYLSFDQSGETRIEPSDFVPEATLADDGKSAASLFKNFIPGESRTVYLVIKNEESTKDINASLSMLAPTEDDDVPIITDASGKEVAAGTEGALYHYFGSQIRITAINDIVTNADSTVTSTSLYTLTGADQFLLPTTLDATTKLQSTYLTSAYTFPTDPKVLTDTFTIDAGATKIIEIVFEFVDNKEVQNTYIDFGKPITTGEGDAAVTTLPRVCKRTLYCTFEETN